MTATVARVFSSLNKKVRSSSLVEVITASVIITLVFAMVGAIFMQVISRVESYEEFNSFENHQKSIIAHNTLF